MNDAVLYWNEVANEADRATHTVSDVREAKSQGPCRSHAEHRRSQPLLVIANDIAQHGLTADAAAGPRLP